HPKIGNADVAGEEPNSVSELYTTLKRFRDVYARGIVPRTEGPTERALFNAFRSSLFENSAFYPSRFELKIDDRGQLFETVKHEGGGQFFVSTTRPGAMRGNHYHVRKLERFMVIEGEAEISLRKLLDTEVLRFRVGGAEPVYIDMPTFYTHAIQNVGSGDLTTLFWSDEMFDVNDPDTYAEPVEA
ncbi:MAG: capsule biosynthesis protein CapF, partial [bacterium]|nr:capsule biosynthesis protein CapF [bacterium]